MIRYLLDNAVKLNEIITTEDNSTKIEKYFIDIDSALKKKELESLMNEKDVETNSVMLSGTMINYMKLKIHIDKSLNNFAEFDSVKKVLDDPKISSYIQKKYNLNIIKHAELDQIAQAVYGLGSGNTSLTDQPIYTDDLMEIDTEDIDIDIDTDLDGVGINIDIDLDGDDMDIDTEDMDIELDEDDIEIDFGEPDEVEETTKQEELETEKPVETDEDSQADLDKAEKRKKVKQIWGSMMESTISGILESYGTLYSSGYGVVMPCGILTENGIVKSRADGQIGYTGDQALDSLIFDEIRKATNGLFSEMLSITSEVDIKTLRAIGGKPVVYPGLHLKYMFGHIRVAKGKDGLKRYLTSKNILLPSEAKAKGDTNGYTINDNENKIIKYSTMRGWIKENLENIFIDSYIEMGVPSEFDRNAVDTVTEINSLLSKSLKNVIAVVERKKGINTRLRICTDEHIDANALIKTLRQNLNTGKADNIKVEMSGAVENGVIDINIIYNNRAFAHDALFAHQVLDILEEQEIVPSWDNVILGKKEDGNIMTYNFKNTKRPLYGMYAGSRSGKGVMTLNVLASGLADGCKVVYVDGKPEMATVLADIAWKNGVDAAVINGLENTPTYGLENRGNCIRTSDRFMSRPHLPEGLFDNEDDYRMFMLTVHYLRGIELIVDLARARMDKCKPNDWIVAVVDECEQMASQEAVINSLLEKTLAKRKKTIDPTDPKGTKKINITTDPIAIFIEEFNTWRERIANGFRAGVKSAFGKGNITLFFVWQSSRFPAMFVKESTIAQLVDSSKGMMTKIIGRAAIEQGGSSDFGNKTTLGDMPWYDSRFQGEAGGYFAIGTSITKDMQVFRPFNIFSDANNKDLILTNSQSAGLTADDLIGSQLDENYNVIPEVGFEGYTNRLLGRFGLKAADQLNIGFKYVDTFVQEQGTAASFASYVYNAHEFKKDSVNLGEEEFDSDGYNVIGDDIESDLDNLEYIGDNQIESDDDFGYDPKMPFGLEEHGDSRLDSQTISEVTNGIAKNIGKYGVASTEPIVNSSIMNELAEQQRIVEANRLKTHQVQSQEPFDLGKKLNGSWEIDELTGIEVLNCNGKQLTRQDIEELSVMFNQPFNDTQEIQSGGKTGRQTYVNNIDSNSDTIELTNKNSIVASMESFDTAERFGDKFFKGLWGSKWQFQKRWEAVLKAMGSNLGDNLVTRVTINNDSMFVNKKQVVMVNILGGDADVRIEDIVEFNTMLKRFPQIRVLAMDGDIKQRLCEMYTDDPVGELFRLGNNLQTVVFIGSSWGDGTVQVTRDMYNQGKIKAQTEKMEAKARHKAQMESVSASNNSRLSSKSPGYQSRVWDSTMQFQGNAWKSVGDNLLGKNPSLFKATTVSAAALISLGVGGALAATGKVLSMFR